VKIVLIIITIILSFQFIAFAQDDTIELTTYYPAPYGDYTTVKTNSLAVGSDASLPKDDGVIQLKSVDTSSLSGTYGPGALAYDSTNGLSEFVTGSGFVGIRSTSSLSLGAWESKSFNTPYEATKDGFVIVYASIHNEAPPEPNAYVCVRVAQSNADPAFSTYLLTADADGNFLHGIGSAIRGWVNFNKKTRDSQGGTITVPIPSGYWWKVDANAIDTRSGYSAVYWMPLE